MFHLLLSIALCLGAGNNLFGVNSIKRQDIFKNVIKNGFKKNMFEQVFVNSFIHNKNFKKQKENVRKQLRYSPGTFETYTIKELREKTKNITSKKRGRLDIISGYLRDHKNSTDVENSRRNVDIGALQAKKENRGATFQLASKFHCLEGGMHRQWYQNATNQQSLKVTTFLKQKHNLPQRLEAMIGTQAVQGEEGSISAFPGAIWRMYGVKQNDANLLINLTNINDKKFIEVSDTGRVNNINLKALYENVIQDPLDSTIAIKTNGTVYSKAIESQRLTNLLANIKVGLHKDTPVTTGYSNSELMDSNIIKFDPKKSEFRKYYRKDNFKDFNENASNPDKQRINQVLTAALNLNTAHSLKYVANNTSIRNLARLIIHASYEGTIRAAALTEKKRLFITSVGTGSFKNDPKWVTEAVERMSQFIVDSGLHVTYVDFNFEKRDKPSYWETKVIPKINKLQMSQKSVEHSPNLLLRSLRTLKKTLARLAHLIR